MKTKVQNLADSAKVTRPSVFVWIYNIATEFSLL